MDREAWWATAPGASKNQTWTEPLSMHSYSTSLVWWPSPNQLKAWTNPKCWPIHEFEEFFLLDCLQVKSFPTPPAFRLKLKFTYQVFLGLRPAGLLAGTISFVLLDPQLPKYRFWNLVSIVVWVSFLIIILSLLYMYIGSVLFLWLIHCPLP